MVNDNRPKKLIEVALPLEAVNEAAAREKSIRHGHPSTLHLWWARRPLAAARAVIFAQMVDDPSSWPELFPTPKAQEKERQRLFRLMEELVTWENTTNEDVLRRAREEIWQSWRRACAQNAAHPRAAELFDRHRLPAFHDPFAGGGALPLEAQRLGLEAHASDLNPVAVLINKAMIEIPPMFAGRPPVWRKEQEKRSKERGAGNDALPESDRLAEGDGGGTRDVPAGPAPAEGGNLRDAVADNTRGGVCPREHRGGVDAGIGQGKGPIPGHSPGLPGGDGDIAHAVRASGMVPGAGDGDASGAGERDKQNAHHAQAQIPESTLTSSSLSSHSSFLLPPEWPGAAGLAEDVRFYGAWMREEAEKRIGHLYPKVEITAEMTKERPDLKPLLGRELTVIAWLWARTVKSPNPAFAHVDVPLVSTFMLSTKAGKEAYVQPVIQGDAYRFTVKMGTPNDPERAKRGTKLSRGANFECLMSGTPISPEYIYAEANGGRMGVRLMAVVAEGARARVYLNPTLEHEEKAAQAIPDWRPDLAMPENPRWFSPPLYGLKRYGDLFTPRQLVALNTFSDLVMEARERVLRDALAAGLPDSPRSLEDMAQHPENPRPTATAYADAVAVYLALGVSKMSDAQSSLCRWKTTMDQSIATFGRQALPMVWDYSEANALGGMAGDFLVSIKNMMRVLDQFSCDIPGVAVQSDAGVQEITQDKVVSTDPPYYDNIGYADLSDFFYVWLRRSLRGVFPGLFSTLAVPKERELVATPYRHGGRREAEAFFLVGMSRALWNLCEQAHPAFPVTIYYAFKQAESAARDAAGPGQSGLAGVASTGWETFLDAVISAGFAITGTWPMRTELANRMIGSGTNALASSIVLVCRRRAADAATVSRRDFVGALREELPGALAHLQRGNIAPVDLAQAAIGPGMGVYTRYARVLGSEGKPVSVREALSLINQVLDEVLSEQENDFDRDSRWALAWFDQFGFGEGEYGMADVLSKAKDTSVAGLESAGILLSKGGKVRLLRPQELDPNWDPAADTRLTVWEMVHYLARALEQGGEAAAAALAARLGARAETARELCYRLYMVCERRRRSAEALSYNGLVQSWPEIMRLVSAGAAAPGGQADLF